MAILENTLLCIGAINHTVYINKIHQLPFEWELPQFASAPIVADIHMTNIIILGDNIVTTITSFLSASGGDFSGFIATCVPCILLVPIPAAGVCSILSAVWLPPCAFPCFKISSELVTCFPVLWSLSECVCDKEVSCSCNLSLCSFWWLYCCLSSWNKWSTTKISQILITCKTNNALNTHLETR